MSTAIDIDGIGKSFGQHAVLKNVSLAVQPGELLALLGPSGSGKTTLLRLIAGLDQPDSGTIRFDRDDALKARPKERNVGFVFQHYALFRHMTVFENIAFSLRIKRIAKAVVNARVEELLKLIQLETLAGRYPAQLSGGQRQRVALARALASQPRVLLLDEPFGALDAVVRRDLRRWLRQLHEEMNITTLFVTHDQEEAFDLADRVVIMQSGAICQEGTPMQIYRDPANSFVHEFLGESNKIACTVHAGAVRAESGLTAAAEAADGAAVAYIRPYQVVPRADPNGAWRVARISATGAQAHVTLRRGSHCVEATMPSEVLLDTGLATGAPAEVSFTGGTLYDVAGHNPAKLRVETPALAAAPVTALRA